ncbi:hypothetical protein K437DRAFT_63476 [Tilletiaria anomala UBC 951]|uniref:Uncharacterized protein n=1 Tax=Tilletiaria anomala (strain ATCC 24038 / CBS 436.72 / UBC 951) TaxID=1037660 RepID=A0A066V3N9_TILAU|nr:uncharacterized protein K437DRAFT_63476 [Tilletiaria anomala UBC 951]KDN36086.1 hypothetical protein K437DRAFT_63476 [Tilletiaria anomala UBC 951]
MQLLWLGYVRLDFFRRRRDVQTDVGEVKNDGCRVRSRNGFPCGPADPVAIQCRVVGEQSLSKSSDEGQSATPPKAHAGPRISWNAPLKQYCSIMSHSGLRSKRAETGILWFSPKILL